MMVATFFSGVGSPEQALRNLDINHEIEFACDIDKYAKETYLKNFKPKLYAEDITSLDMQDLPYVDLLVFGFPCQAFSLAGNRKGFDDTRGTLFYDALRYLKEHKPRYFIAENVKGLLSHDNGKTFQTIIDCLAKTTNYQMSLMPFDNLAYHIHYKVLNTKDFGLPQNRERIFIIGIRDDEDNNFNFPKEISLELKLKDILQDNPDYFKLIDGFHSYDKIKYVDNEIVGTLTEHQSRSGITNGFKIETNFSNKVDEKYYLSDEQYKKMQTRNRYGDHIIKKDDHIHPCLLAIGKSDVGVIDENNYIIAHSLYPRSSKTGEGGTGHLSKSNGTSYCIDTGNAQAIEIKNPQRIRRLTPIECERLQGFPDNFTAGVSDTQRYKQMGNTITVNVIQAIIKKLINVII